MKPVRLSNALHIRGATYLLLIPTLLMNSGCNDKFEITIYKPDRICDSYTSAAHDDTDQTPMKDTSDRATDRPLCTGSPVKLLLTRTTSSVSVSGARENK